MVLCFAAPGAAGHQPAAADGVPTLATAWTLDPWLIAPLSIMLLLYAVGAARLWRGVGIARAAAFTAGAGLVFAALVWPLDAYGEWSFAAHMAQHMILLAAAPPLLLLGRPGPAIVAALPLAAGRALARPRHLLDAVARPGLAMLLQIVVVWGWHAPAATDLALRNDLVHYAMHASFFGIGLLFWAALIRAVRDPRAGFGPAAAAIAGTMIQMGLLSALLTFGGVVRYPFYAQRAPALGLSPLEDQQLAGLIMWVPGALPYVIGALVLVAAWLARAERSDRLWPTVHTRR